VPERSVPPASTTTAASAPEAAAKDTAAKTVGTLFIDVKPWGEVLVNGTSRGVSPPLKRLSLPEGEYTIELANQNFPKYSAEIQIRKNTTVTVSHQFK
jgi:PEGA domain-containing protein